MESGQKRKKRRSFETKLLNWVRHFDVPYFMQLRNEGVRTVLLCRDITRDARKFAILGFK
jgi:hypothetical protein